MSSTRLSICLTILAALGALGLAQEEAPFVIKSQDTKIPKEVHESIAKLLRPEAIHFADNKENPICEIWLRKELPAEATAEQIKNGLTYRELKESTVLGVVRFADMWQDYRKQKIKPGVYTLRLGFQPMDGDHSGSSDSLDFVLLLKADADTKPDLIEPKALYERSMKSIGTGHPGVLMLFANNKPADKPQLGKRTSKDNLHWVLSTKQDVLVGKQKASIGIALTLVGHGE